MMKRTWPGIGAFIGMLLLILDSKTALSGARTGVELCLKTVIPSLFPFLVLSPMLTSLPLPLGRLWPKGAEGLLVPAFLGGYPVGAQSVAAAYGAGRLRKEDAERMLGYSCNAGPAFLFGMASSLFPRQWMVWALWGIHIASALMTARVLALDGGQAPTTSDTVSLSEALGSALGVMGAICGWVVLFRVVTAFLYRWVFWCIPEEVQVALTGLLELTNGCFELPRVSSIPLRFTLCSGMLAAGGLCVAMQVRSVTRGLSLRYYSVGKLLQVCFSLLLCGCIFRGRFSCR